MILVSACLIGENVRYDGDNSLNEKIRRLMDEGSTLPVCPEVAGGLATPRKPAEIRGGDGHDVLAGNAGVIDTSGADVTEQFLKGAYDTLAIIKQYAPTMVVLKENSPSCGSSNIYDGTFSGRKVPGAGVTTALLEQNGIRVISEQEFDAL
ncbi:DUF523 domain-containing protein [Lacicoccus alkaliphilus]|uniref:Uncharacterized conserved protein YbbK, DUF523 family n=1 Tax=Lacicoccus alkaliphilus DSM 16010 TaxID=1123231 RepID=A0A1M7HIB3_9BACL|nr:DUF523 domain-containing protein [Salinicoccus alkaliphilus]SHM28053.1 Uncharacterized conserved protein YbbK, DUF523 family [Salinicoccus alkaliphilus DSM 16010]